MTAMNPGPGPAEDPSTPTPPSTPAVPAPGGLPQVLGLVVLGLGVVAALLGFADFYSSPVSDAGVSLYAAGSAPVAIGFLLLAGLLAAVALLPKQTAQAGLLAAASATGFVVLLFQVVGSGDGADTAFGGYLLLLVGLVQAAAAVFALLLGAGMVKAPAPKPKAPAGSWQTGQTGQFGQPGQYGQGGYGQPGQYGQPQQGGYGQPQPGQYGQPQQGGYGQPQPGQYGQPAPQQPAEQGGWPPAPPQPGQYGSAPAPGAPAPQQGAGPYTPPTQAFGAPQQAEPDGDGAPGNPYGAPRG